MSRFYVGQRVRMARPVFSENLNKTGVIREMAVAGETIEGGRFDCFVDWDDGWRDGITVKANGCPGATHTSQLEPLYPPHEPGSWEAIDKLLPNLRGVHA